MGAKKSKKEPRQERVYETDLDKVLDELKSKYGDNVVLDADAEIQLIITQWLDEKRTAKRYNDDTALRQIDIEYSTKLRNLMHGKNIPDAGSVAPPLQVPISIFGGKSPKDFVRKLKTGDIKKGGGGDV